MSEMKDVIAARRKALGFTQEQLAQKMGISAKVVSKWETGRSLPDTAFLPALCNILKITSQELLFPDSFSAETHAAEKVAEMQPSEKPLENRAGRTGLKTAEIVCISSFIFAAVLFLTGFFVSHGDYYGKYAPLVITFFILSVLFCLGGIAAFLILRAKFIGKCTLADDKRNIYHVTVFTYGLISAVTLIIGCVLCSDYGGAELFDVLAVIAVVFVLFTFVFILLLLWNKRRG